MLLAQNIAFLGGLKECCQSTWKEARCRAKLGNRYNADLRGSACGLIVTRRHHVLKRGDGHVAFVEPLLNARQSADLFAAPALHSLKTETKIQNNATFTETDLHQDGDSLFSSLRVGARGQRRKNLENLSSDRQK